MTIMTCTQEHINLFQLFHLAPTLLASFLVTQIHVSFRLVEVTETSPPLHSFSAQFLSSFFKGRTKFLTTFNTNYDFAKVFVWEIMGIMGKSEK